MVIFGKGTTGGMRLRMGVVLVVWDDGTDERVVTEIDDACTVLGFAFTIDFLPTGRGQKFQKKPFGWWSRS